MSAPVQSERKKRIVNVDKRAFEALYAAEVAGVFGYVLVRCGSRVVAEDVTAQTFLEAARLNADGRLDEVTAPWLRVVARRRLIDHWRARSRHDRRVDALANQLRIQPTLSPDHRVWEALDSLADRQRAALALRYLDDFSVSEVADALDLSYKGAESLLSRARAAFTTAYGATHG